MAYKKLFPAQEESEKVFLLVRRHWFTYAIFWFFSFLMLVPSAGVLAYWFYNPDISSFVGNIIILGESAYSLSVLAVLLYGFVDYYLDIYIVTDRRLVDIKQNGFFHREISELYLREVQDVKAKVDGFFPTTLHYGQVIIQTAGEIENFIFDSVPHPYAISKKIIDLHEMSVRRRPNDKKKTLKNEQDEDKLLESKGFPVEARYLTDDETEADEPQPEEVMKRYENSDDTKNIDTNIPESVTDEGLLEEGKQINIEQ
ncbi:MAG: PH domain-containing protein [Patescibacteria group bacterium]|nr:PH domain-containing protein [Patescibacteria group bacterium]